MLLGYFLVIPLASAYRTTIATQIPIENPLAAPAECCAADEKWSVDPVHIEKGKCCPLDTTYSFDYEVGNGGCCQSGKRFVESACTDPTSRIAPPLSCLSPPSTPKCACPGSNTSHCPSSGTLGIKYGHCYTITDLQGKPVTRSNDATPPNAYISSGYWYFGGPWGYRTIPFRICENEDKNNCTGNVGKDVSDGGSWFLLDQTGYYNQQIPDFVGVRPYGGGYFLSLMDSAVATDKPNIRRFTANIKCLFGKCSPCLSLVPKAGVLPAFVGLFPYDFFGYEYGDTARLTDLKNSCLSVILQETACPTWPLRFWPPSLISGHVVIMSDFQTTNALRKFFRLLDLGLAIRKRTTFVHDFLRTQTQTTLLCIHGKLHSHYCLIVVPARLMRSIS